MWKFITDHWRGQFTLATAFWVVVAYFSVYIFLFSYTMAVFNVIQDQVVSTRVWLAATAILLLIILPWMYIGALRSILLHMFKLMQPVTAFYVLLCWFGALAFTIHQFQINTPMFITMANIAFHDEADELEIQVQGDVMTLRGELNYGAHKKFKQALKNQPGIETIELDLNANHIHEAREIAKTITKAGLNTHVSGSCIRNCLVTFAGGVERTATENAHFEFYEYKNYVNGYRSDWLIYRERLADREYFAERGATVRLSYELYYRHNDNAPYIPKARYLLWHNLVTEII